MLEQYKPLRWRKIKLNPGPYARRNCFAYQIYLDSVLFKAHTLKPSIQKSYNPTCSTAQSIPPEDLV